MREKKDTTLYVQKAVICILVILSVFASVTKIFTGFDIDEAYALAIPYRILQGDRLFADMWEVHQTSFLLPYLFMKLFEMVTGSMEGVVLYTRIVTTMLHLGVSLLVWKCLKKIYGNKYWLSVALLGLAYYDFLPKWMINMDFSMQQLWFFTLFVICLFYAGIFDGAGQDGGEKGISKRKAWLAAAGLMLALDVLAYPGMVLVYPAVVILLAAGKRQGKWADIFSLTAGCAAAALVFFVFIFSYMTPAELLSAIPRVFMDGSHQYDWTTKLRLYVSQWAEVLVQSAILLVPAAIGAGIIKMLYGYAAKKKTLGQLPFGLLLCIVLEGMVSALIAFAGLFVTWGPFRLQVRYILQFIMAFCIWKSLYGKGKREKEGEDAGGRLSLWLLWLSLAAFWGILLASNVGPVSSSSYLIIGNLVFVALSIQAVEHNGIGIKGLAYGGAVLFLLSLIMCKGYYMRNTEYVPGDISEPLSKMQEGPMAGIYVPQKDFARYTDDYETIKGNTTDYDRVLFMGTEGLCNLYANGKIVIPTTISTPAFNEQWVEYFTLYPDKQPTVIFLAKNTVDDRRKFFVKNEFGIWIAERYDVECMEETESLCMIRLRE